MDKRLLSGVSPVQASKELSRIVETVTCLECCKFYILPETAVCGHTLCHGCWIGRQTCAICASPLTRRMLKPNSVLNKYSKCVLSLVSSFEKLFGIKLEEFVQDLPVQTMSVLNKDPNKNVRAWLADSQNQFSAPVSTQQSTQAKSFAVEVKTCDIQVHTDSKKTASPVKVVLAPAPPQDDWDKIETIPDTEDIIKNKENVGAINQEFESFDEEYTTDHPRRSSRKREYKNEHSKAGDHSVDKHSSSNLSVDTDKLSKIKQNWSNVKRMRKEFSKLHKKNKNKLNVSIEMCKKTQSAISKPITAPVDIAESQNAITIDECTPNINLEKKETTPAPDKVTTVGTKHDKDDDINDKAKSQVADEEEKSSRNMKPNVTQEKFTPSTDLNEKGNIPFLKKSALQRQSMTTDLKDTNVESTNHTINCNNQTTDSDDIQITIKIGSTLTNILIKKKKNDVQVKLKTDQAAQTTQSVEKSILCEMSPSAKKDCDIQNIEISIGDKHVVSAVTQQINDNGTDLNNKVNLDKTVSTKKNTASAETVPFEITESVEKELSKIMECDIDAYSVLQNGKSVKNTQIDQQNEANMISASEVAVDKETSQEAIELDEDLFASGLVKESEVKERRDCVQLLKGSKPAASEVLMPTLKQKKTQTQRQADKRERENDEDIPSYKKVKVATETNTDNSVDEIESNQIKHDGNQSCSMNYDSVMGQVFASIDADMEHVDKSQSIIKHNESKVQAEMPQYSQQLKTQKTQKTVLGLSKLANATQNVVSNFHQKESENLFTQSMRESQIEHQQKHGPETQAHIENLLTPGMCRDLVSTNTVQQDQEEDDSKIEATPCQDKDDSDMSIYEDTPQKTSFTNKPSNTASGSGRPSKTNTQKSPHENPRETRSRTIINISDTENTKTDKDVTVVQSKPKQTLETPTINQFYNQIKHNSTPVARKSLNFVSLQDQTVNKSMSILSKNTQEQEIIAKAFESTPRSFAKPLPVFPPAQKLCIAASCLTQAEVKILETLCKQRKWVFVREYTKDLTHLVVGVDKEGRSQRTVKFMCAVAAGKWIVKYDWVTECIKRGMKVPEWSYEALDWTGDPGPARARSATRKLFDGFTFFCKPPFTVLNEAVLKTMLEGAGGTVVAEARQVRVTGDPVRLLLAEPEHTQENQFTYLALELSIVPVNYEWALNCLGSYCLSSIMDLLLCPASLLPAAAQRWPAAIVAQDGDADSSE